MTRFTTKQQAFIDNYIKTLNGTEAARLAKYQGNDNTLGVVAHENLRKPKIRAEIDRLLKELAITDDEILYRLQEQATADLGDTLKIDGNFATIDLGKLKEAGKTHLLKKFKVTKTGVEVEFYDSQAALVHLAKLRGMIEDKIRIEDWQTDIIELLRTGRLSPEDIKAAYPDLAAQFFAKAGIDANSNG